MTTLNNYPRAAILDAYGLNYDATPAEIGQQALLWGDISETGELS